MRISCIHCGQPFSITASQLGGRGHCPHCRGEIHLPKATDETEQASEKREPSHWLQHSLSGLLSLTFHIILILILALITYGSHGGTGRGEDVLIGKLPSQELGDSQDEQLEAAEVAPDTSSDFTESLEVDPPVNSDSEMDALDEMMAASPSAAGSAATSVELGATTIGRGSMSGGDWNGLLQSLRRHGLDIVLTFDSTGSMQGEIDQVKAQIQRIGSTLLTLVPKARISICTYRDRGDEYVVRGLPLTSDLQRIQQYLSRIQAGGGGDRPEAVHEGLRWSIEQNTFRRRARKVILLFGDAPPHQQYLPDCLRLASDFQGVEQGIVSTITCRASRKLREFVEIADVGGGEGFLTTDEQQIMTQLIVLVFGSRHRSKVLEAFKLLEKEK
ncbi:MAG: VWA domain-containing protein [Pirellulaceae bacterium]